MRLIITILFAFFITTSIAQSKDYDSFYERIKSDKNKIEELDNRVLILTNEQTILRDKLENEEYKSSKNETTISFLQNEISRIEREKQDFIYDLEGLKTDLLNFLNENCNDITSSGLKELCSTTKKELGNNKFILEGKDGEIDIKDETIKNLRFSNSYISNFEIGKKVGNGFKSIKKYKNDKIYFSKGTFGKLNRINAFGKVYFSKQDIVETNGKLLLYSNDKLYQTVNVELKEGNYISSDIAEYELNLVNKEIEKGIPSGKVINVGFTDNKTYLENKEFFNNFWDASSSGKFIISNIKPRKENVYKIDNLLSNCTNKRKIRTNSDYIFVSIRDNADVDGDIASIFVNNSEKFNSKVNNQFTEPKKIYLRKGKNQITLVAISTGLTYPCTIELKINDNDKIDTLILKGNKNDTECIEIIKN